jgi:hypothetical protein
MTVNLPIVFKKKDNFEKSEFIQFLKNSYKVTCEDKNETTTCKIESIGTTILIHKYKITIQGQLNRETKELISKMRTLDKLTLNPRDLKKYEEIFQPNNGLIICQDCGQPSEVIEGVSDSSENPMFKCSCGHELMTNSPILIARNRILPDLNILISRTLSRLIKIGYFNGFEIIIPEYFDKFVDQCFSKGRRRNSFLSEREDLSKLAKQGMIRFQIHPYGGSSIANCNDEGKIEDDKIFDFATKTHSILITADRTLKEKSIEHNLECIYFTSDLNNSAKLQSQLSLK